MRMEEQFYRLMTEVKYLNSKDLKDYAKEKGYTINEKVMTNIIGFAATEYGTTSNAVIDKLDSLKRSKEIPVEQKEVEMKKVLDSFFEEMEAINTKIYQLVDIMCKSKAVDDPEAFKNDLIALTKLFDYDDSEIDEMFLHIMGMPAPDELLPEEYVGSEKYKEFRSNGGNILALYKELEDYLSKNQPVDLPDLFAVDDIMRRCLENNLSPISPLVLEELVRVAKEMLSNYVIEPMDLLIKITTEQERISTCIDSKEDVEFIKRLQELKIKIHEEIKSFVETINNGLVEMATSLSTGEEFDRFVERMKNVFDLSDADVDYASRFDAILKNPSSDSSDATKANVKKAEKTKPKKAASSGSNDIDRKLSAFIDI